MPNSRIPTSTSASTSPKKTKKQPPNSAANGANGQGSRNGHKGQADPDALTRRLSASIPDVMQVNGTAVSQGTVAPGRETNGRVPIPIEPLPKDESKLNELMAVPLPETSAGDAPESVADFVKRQRPRTLRLQIRFFRTLIFAFWLFGRLIFWQLYMARAFPNYVSKTNTRRWQKYARQFRHFAVRMGGVMIKAGQFASTRADTLPEEVLAELATLQDEVPTIPFKRIRRVLREELGDDYETRYDWIREDPVAAASLGQVHRAKLRDGDRVVVKVQRPGIRDTVYTDLTAMFIVARVAMRFEFINRRADAVELVEEFGRVLLEEVSYQKEASNAQRFAKMFKNNMGVYIPAIYPEHCTDKVLTIEDVTSIKINDFAALEAAGIDRKTVAKRLMDTYMTQIFESRFFHADPHPGNLFVYPLPVEDESQYVGKGGRPFYLIFIDFGMTGELTKEITEGLIDTLTAIIMRDAGRMVEAYQKLGFLLPNADIQRIREATQIVFDQVWGLSMMEMARMDFDEIQAIGYQFNDLLYDMPFRVPQDFVYLGRSVGILTGICTTLDEDYNPWTEIQANMRKLITEDQEKNIFNEVGGALMQPVTQLVNGGPSAFFEALRRLFDSLPAVQMLTNQNSARAVELLEQIVSGEVAVVAKSNPSQRRQMERIEAQNRRTIRAFFFGTFFVTGTLFYTGGDVALAVFAYGVSGVSLVMFLSTKEQTPF